jgi:hypothetical protein
MKYASFIKRFFNNGRVLKQQLGGDFRCIEPTTIMKFKELTSLVDYNCGFDSDGLCKVYKRMRKELGRKAGRKVKV